MKAPLSPSFYCQIKIWNWKIIGKKEKELEKGSSADHHWKHRHSLPLQLQDDKSELVDDEKKTRDIAAEGLLSGASAVTALLQSNCRTDQR